MDPGEAMNRELDEHSEDEGQTGPGEAEFPVERESSKKKKRSFSASQKLEAIELAKVISLSEVARQHHTTQSTIRSWIKNASKLQALHNTGTYTGSPALLPTYIRYIMHAYMTNVVIPQIFRRDMHFLNSFQIVCFLAVF